MGKIDSKATVKAGVDTLTCQYNKYYNKSCDSGYVLMPNAVAKDTCNRKGTIDLTPKDATCPPASKFGADVREVIEAGKDQCFYYEKPTTPS